MVKKLLGFALLISLITPLPATARAIWMREKTSDGSLLYVETNYEPVSQSGWTVFKYGINKDGSLRENIGVTPYCTHGQVHRNERATRLQLPIPGWAETKDINRIRQISSISNLSNFITAPGWIVVLDGKVTAIEANSPGSRSLLSVVCSY